MLLPITAAEFVDAPMGVPVEDVPFSELEVLTSTAYSLACAHVHTRFEYRENVRESHLWGGIKDDWFYLNYQPIRTITAFAIVVGMGRGTETKYSIDPAYLKLDADTNTGQASSFMLQMGLVPFNVVSITPEIEVTYTSGYDNGQVQADGLSIPWPSWLKDATRIILADLVGEWRLATKGMTGLQRAGAGPISYDRPMIRNPLQGVSIPLAAASILTDNYFRVEAGVIGEGVPY